MKRTLALAGAAMLGIPLYCGAQNVHTYTLTDLGTVTYNGGMIDWVNAERLNSAGDVVGNVSSSMPGAPYYAFLYEGGSIINLGTLGGQTSGAERISDAGQVVGSALTSANVGHAFLYQDNVMQDLGTLGGATSVAYAISSCNGLIAGNGDTSSGNSHAFLYTNGVMQDLGTFGGPNSGARGVNPSWQVVGFANTTGTEANGFA